MKISEYINRQGERMYQVESRVGTTIAVLTEKEAEEFYSHLDKLLHDETREQIEDERDTYRARVSNLEDDIDSYKNSLSIARYGRVV